MDASNLAGLLEKLRGPNVLVCGDLMVDEFIYGKVTRISPEAPVPILEFGSDEIVLGGAANGAANIAALGGQPYLIGCIGQDQAGARFEEKLAAAGLVNEGVVVDPARRTTHKTRVIAHNQHVIRIDREDVVPLSDDALKRIRDNIERAVKNVKAVLISDYQKGTIGNELASYIIEEAAKAGLPVVVDTKTTAVDVFAGATVLTPNLAELEKMSGVSIVDEESLALAAGRLLKDGGVTAVLATLSEKGMTLFTAGGDAWHLPAHSIAVHDVTGAGDTVASTIALALAGGLRLEDAVTLANYAAAVVVRKVGTAVARPAEILHLVEGED